MATKDCANCGRRSEPTDFLIHCDHCGQFIACLLTRQLPLKTYCVDCYRDFEAGDVRLDGLTLDDIPF